MVGVATASGVQSITVQDTADYDDDGYYSNFDLVVDADSTGNGGIDDAFDGADPYFEVWINGQLVKTTNVDRRSGEFSITLPRSTLEQFEDRGSLSIEVRLLDQDTFEDDLMGSSTTTVTHEPVPASQLALESLHEYDRLYENFRTARLSEDYWEAQQFQQLKYAIEAILPLSWQDISKSVLEEKIPSATLVGDFLTVVEVGLASKESLDAGKRFTLLDELEKTDGSDYTEFQQTLVKLEKNTRKIETAPPEDRDKYLQDRLDLLETAYKQVNDNQNNLRAAFSSQRKQDPDMWYTEYLYGVKKKHYDALKGEFIKAEQTLRTDYTYTQTALERSGIRKLESEAGYTPPDYPNPTVTISAPDTAVVGEPTTVSITVENTGGRAISQTAALSFPDADASHVSISQTGVADPNYADVFGAGEPLGQKYGAESSIEASYPLVETGTPLDGGDSFTMKVTVVPEQTGDFRIYGKSVARNGGWFAYPRVTSSKPTDQQDEKVIAKTITITEPNHSPSANDVSLSTNEGGSASGSFDASDPDGDSLTYSVVDNPNHGSVSTSGSSFTYTPNSGYSGSDSFTYRASDGNGKDDTATVSVTVSAVNQEPTATDFSISTSEETTVSDTFVGSDPDGDSLTYSLTNTPSHGSVSINGDQFSYTPNTGYSGTDTFTYQVEDGNGGEATATVSISISETNAAPNVNDVSLSTSEGASVSGSFDASDPDGDSLSYSVTSSPDHGSVSTSGSSFTYTPESGYSGSDSFTYRASDGEKENTATVSLSVSATNAAPNVNDLSRSTSEGTSVSGTFDASDPDGDSLSYSVTSSPDHGSVSTSGSSFTYTPESGYSGSDSFTYRASDGETEATATVSISVSATNADPNADDQSLSTSEGTSVSDSFDASDPDSDSLSYSIVSTPNHGTVSISGESFTYIPNSDYSGDDSFTYEVTDGDEGTDTATVSISISADKPNADPNANHVSVSTSEGESVSDTFDANDPDGGPLSYSITSEPDHGSVTISEDQFTYMPALDYSGSDSFSYEVIDKKGNTATATVSITISATNTPPNANAVSVSTDKGTAVTGTFNTSDPEQDSLSYSVVNSPSHGSVSVSGGQFTYTPNADYSGKDEFTYRATGKDGGSDTATVSISVITPASPTFNATITETNFPIEVGSRLSVTVKIKNTDVQAGTQSVKLRLVHPKSPSTDKVNIQLDAGESTTRVLSVKTTTYDAHIYPAEIIINDTIKAAEKVWLSEASGDFEVDVDVPSQVKADYSSTEPFDIITTISNTGAHQAKKIVKLTIYSSLRGETFNFSAPATLKPGKSLTGPIRGGNLSLPLKPGDTIDIIVETPSDSATAEVDVVDSPPKFELLYVHSNSHEHSPVKKGKPLNLTVAVRNTGGRADTQTITVEGPGLGDAEADIQLAVGEKKEQTFQLPTNKSKAGSHTLTVSSKNTSLSEDIRIAGRSSTPPLRIKANTADTDVPPGGSSAITYTIDNVSVQNSVTLNFTELSNQVTIVEDASDFDGGVYNNREQAALWLNPSSETVSITVVFSIDKSASPDRTFTVEAQAMDEDAIVADRVQTEIGDIQQSVPQQYDENGDQQVGIKEVRTGINDFAAGELTIQEVRKLINYWADGTAI